MEKAVGATKAVKLKHEAACTTQHAHGTSAAISPSHDELTLQCICMQMLVGPSQSQRVDVPAPGRGTSTCRMDGCIYIYIYHDTFPYV